MQRKNLRYLILMVASVLTVLVLQFFWLKSVYNDYKTSLKQEAALLFANTVTDMLDSLVLRKMTPVFIPGMPDTAFIRPLQIGKKTTQDTIRSFRIEIRQGENEAGTKGRVNRQIQVISSGENVPLDSLRSVVRPLMLGLDSLGEGKKFTFRLDEETLSPEEIESTFEKALIARGYEVNAKVRKYHIEEPLSQLPKNVIDLKEIRIPFGTRIQGYLYNYQVFLYKKMIVPSLFALLVVLFISWSMLAMYRNMLKQQRLNLLKNDIISNITHELKTPVATVAIVLESLENFGSQQKEALRKEYIQIAKNELKRLTQMAENILTSSLLEKEQKVSFKPIELDVLLEEKIQSFKPILDHQNFEFQYIKEGKNFSIIGDWEKLGLVIFNLLDNAVKYSKEEKNIQVKLRESGGKIILQIQDKGIGIPEAYQKEIFEKFIRVPQQDVHDVKGYGLGLAQVAEIIRLHDGKISLESKVGQGSVFTLQFQQV
ncbi:sensor histidine kinase [Cecembia calidifontis]|uniref:histidine kinase n=1 Tax=Cecembia calidifontis TaxID=1187080 RepID=A0A4Q7PBK5_9BACT|nr:HAMP domain-containing sensor histidine kinase [Cecembia calidifontis]RZS97621.1 phospho-acceptor domain-containing protein [Cecembia calidifontis]